MRIHAYVSIRVLSRGVEGTGGGRVQEDNTTRQNRTNQANSTHRHFGVQFVLGPPAGEEGVVQTPGVKGLPAVRVHGAVRLHSHRLQAAAHLHVLVRLPRSGQAVKQGSQQGSQQDRQSAGQSTGQSIRAVSQTGQAVSRTVSQSVRAVRRAVSQGSLSNRAVSQQGSQTGQSVNQGSLQCSQLIRAVR